MLATTTSRTLKIFNGPIIEVSHLVGCDAMSLGFSVPVVSSHCTRPEDSAMNSVTATVNVGKPDSLRFKLTAVHRLIHHVI